MGLITRETSETSDKYGTYPEDRDLQELLDFGFVVIDKPSGPTSHQVSAYVQQILGIDKSGHSGTLDPKVTGVLPIATGNATRLLEYLLKAGKTYVGVMRLHGDVDDEKLEKTKEEFIGRITQLPPKRSAVKRQERKRTIYDFEFLEQNGRDILFRADVEAGTYLRKLCHDFGQRVGVGAHMAELRRTRAAQFNEEFAVTLQQLSDAYALAQEGDLERFHYIFVPGEIIVDPLPPVVILDSAVHSITHGATLKVPGIAAVADDIQKGDTVRIMTQKEELVAIGTARMDSEQMLGDSGIAVKPDKVVMDSSVYPRMD